MKYVLVVASLAIVCATACSPPASQSTTSTSTSAQVAIPAPTPATENSKRFQIGTLNAVALRDGAMSEPNDGHSFIVGQSTADVAALLTAAGAPTDQIAVSLEPLYVDAGDKKLLFDTGLGAGSPNGGQLGSSMQAAGIDPASITDVFISHAHGDHIGGLVHADGAPAFPNATIHMSATEWAGLRTITTPKAEQRHIQNAQQIIAAITPKIATFAPGATILPGLVTAVDIKGHTPGHSGYRITQGDQSLFYIGDAMHSSILSVARPAWLNAFDENQTLAARSRTALVADAITTHQRLYAYHFPFPGIGTLEKRGAENSWIPES